MDKKPTKDTRSVSDNVSQTTTHVSDFSAKVPSKNFIETNPYGSDYESDGQLSLHPSDQELSEIFGGVVDDVPTEIEMVQNEQVPRLDENVNRGVMSPSRKRKSSVVSTSGKKQKLNRNTDNGMLYDTNNTDDRFVTLENRLVSLTGAVENLVGISCTVNNQNKSSTCVPGSKVDSNNKTNDSGVTGFDPTSFYDDFMEASDDADENNDDDSGDFLIPEIFEEDQYGPDIGEKVKNLISKACTQPAPELKKVTEKYLNPKNCSDSLRVPKINRDVWSKLRKQGQSRDVILQDIQKQFIKGLNPIAKVLDMAVSKPKTLQCKEIMPLLVDGISIMGNTIYQMSIKRRLICRSSLPRYLSPICSQEQPMNKELFGDNSELNKKMSSLFEENKRKFNVFNNQSRGQFGRGQRFHFLDNRGQRSRGRSRGRYPYNRRGQTQQSQSWYQ